MNAQEMVNKLKTGGFRYPEELIHTFQGGSYQHGASIASSRSDVDLFGVYIEPPSKALGIQEETHFTGGTQDQYERNRPGDEDYKCYTLRRWAGLACKGNPTVLGFLYSKDELLPGVWKDLILPNQNLFKARFHAKAFLGYAEGQISRLNGKSGKGKHGQRPELEKEFGYDTKAAMHLMRLMFEAQEYMKTGNITYPRPEKDLLIKIRLGSWSFDRLMLEYTEAEAKVIQAMNTSSLPDTVDRNVINELVTTCYLRHWEQRSRLETYTIKGGSKSAFDPTNTL
jgi:predicted nucleotidyltransferase